MKISMQSYDNITDIKLPDVVFDLDVDGVEITVGDTVSFVLLSEFQPALVALLAALVSMRNCKKVNK